MEQWINVLLYVVSVMFAILSIIVGIFYAKENKKTVGKNNSTESQKIVDDNLDIFGICNQGETMDNHDVYCVPYNKIGL